MNPVITRPSPAPVRSIRSIALAVAGVIAALVFLIGANAVLRSPGTVDEVTIDNATPFPVHVDVRAQDGGGRLGLGVVSADGSQTFREVVDQGGQWVFRFSSGQARGGELVVSRDDLADRDWTVSVPEAVVERLDEEGAAPEAS